MHRSLICAFLAATMAQASMAKEILIVTDIVPVGALVKSISGDLADVHILVSPNASPHDFSLRPSDARKLSSADAVLWIGPELTPWLEGRIDTLANTTTNVQLLDLENVFRLDARQEFSIHHDAHDDHTEHDGHDDRVGHDEHEGHHHDGIDPHAWLDPNNAKKWLAEITRILSDIDPENRNTFEDNLKISTTLIDDAVGKSTALLKNAKNHDFIVYHDAFQYYENNFSLSVIGALSLSDATPPSASHVTELRRTIREHSVKCILAEPQYNENYIETLSGETALHVAQLPLLGIDQPMDHEYYPKLITEIAQLIESCSK